MRDKITSKIVITTTYTDDIPEIHMVSGVITWDDSTGYLTSNWRGSFSSGLQLKSYGKYSDIKGGSVLINSYTLIDILNNNNIALSGAIIQVVDTVLGAHFNAFYGEITGIPTLQKEKNTLIRFEALERNRNTLATSLLPDSEDYYPVFYGNGKQKLTNVEFDEYTPRLTTGAVPALVIASSGSFDYYTTLVGFLLVDVDSSEASVLASAIDEYVGNGYQLVLESNGDRLSISDYSFGYGFAGALVNISLTLKDGNVDVDNGGIGAQAKCTLTLVKSINYADPQAGPMAIYDSIYNYNNSRYIKLPDYTDSLSINGYTVEGSASNGFGYYRIDVPVFNFITSGYLPSWLDMSGTAHRGWGWWSDLGGTGSLVSGNSSSPVDYDLATALETRIDADTVVDLVRNGFFLEIPPFAPGEIPDSIFLTGKIEHAMTGSGAGAAWKNMSIDVAIDNRYEKVDWTNMISVSQSSIIGVVMSAGSYYGVLKNWLPSLENNFIGIAGAKGFRYEWDVKDDYEIFGPDSQNINGFAIDILPLIDTTVGYELSAGATVYVRYNILSSDGILRPANIESINMRFYDVSLVYPVDFDYSEIYIDSTGRATNIKDMYRDALQRQNYKANSSIAPPVEGWGLTIPSGVDWTTIYDDTTIENALPDADVYYQYDKVDTKTLKADILKHTACIAGVGRDGLERVFDASALLYDITGPIMELEDNYTGKKNPKPEDQLPDIKEKESADIFPRINVSYYSNVATDKTTKTISIVNVSQYGANSVVAEGLTDIEKREVWDLANSLYKGWGNVNTMPDSTGKNFLFKDESSAIEFIKRTYALQGATLVTIGDNTIVDSFQRFTVISKLYKKWILDNSVDVGSPVRIRRVDTSLITGVVANIVDKGDYYSVTTEAVGGSLTGATSFIYVETGSADTEIVETGTQTTDIVEG